MASKFIKAFVPSNQEHVEWLKNLLKEGANLNQDVISFLNKNPLGVKLDRDDELQWVHVQFSLCAVYAKAVLNGQAFIPTQ